MIDIGMHPRKDEIMGHRWGTVEELGVKRRGGVAKAFSLCNEGKSAVQAMRCREGIDF